MLSEIASVPEAESLVYRRAGRTGSAAHRNEHWSPFCFDEKSGFGYSGGVYDYFNEGNLMRKVDHPDGYDTAKHGPHSSDRRLQQKISLFADYVTPAMKELLLYSEDRMRGNGLSPD